MKLAKLLSGLTECRNGGRLGQKVPKELRERAVELLGEYKISDTKIVSDTRFCVTFFFGNFYLLRTSIVNIEINFLKENIMKNKFNFLLVLPIFLGACPMPPPSGTISPSPSQTTIQSSSNSPTATPTIKPTNTPSPDITPTATPGTQQTTTPSPSITPTAIPTTQPTSSPPPDKPVQSVKLFFNIPEVPIADSTSNLSPIYIQLNVPYPLKGKITFTDNSSTENIGWSSSDQTTLSVDTNGTAKGLKEGEAEIIVSQKNSQKELFRAKAFVLKPCRGEPSSLCTEKVAVIGKVYDSNNNLLDGVRVTAKSEDQNEPFNDEQFINKEFAFKYPIGGVTLELTASKEGYITQKRTVRLKSNIGNYNIVNVYNFGGSDSVDKPFALQKQ